MLRALPEAERPVVVVSNDEKPGIQAIATTAPDLLPRPGRYATVQRDHEYKRLGTVTRSAAVDLVTGFVHHAVTQRHRPREFVAFPQQLDTACPAGLLICILLDNRSVHRSRETMRLLAQTAGSTKAGLWWFANRQTDIGGLRSDGDDQEGAGSDHPRSRHAGEE